MLIGRKKQQAELMEAYHADDSKFVAGFGVTDSGNLSVTSLEVYFL